MQDVKDDIYSLREKWSRVCINNMELRGSIRNVIDYCEGVLKDKNISNECFRIANDVLHMLKDGGV